MNFLVVEDDFASSKLLSIILKKYGHCDVAENGIEAMKFFEKSLLNMKYDVIFLDIMMPELNGQETLIKIRSLEEKANILKQEKVRVVMTTALGDFDNVKMAYTSLCEDYLIKPINRDKVEKSLKKLGLLSS